MSVARRLAAIGVLALAGALLAAPAAGAKGKVRGVPKSGVVKLGKVRCAAAEACVVRAKPRWISGKAAGRRVRARVLVPFVLGSRHRAWVKLRLGAGARERMAGRAATFRARVVLRGLGRKVVRRFKVRLRRRAPAAAGAPGGSGAGGEGAHSEPVSGEPPALARPLTAVSVQGVSLSWLPRASWVRYVASGEGTVASGGARTVGSEVSPCPARAGSREGSELAPEGVEYPYEIDFAAAPSWYDPVSGKAAINGTGSAAFRFRGHTINLTGSEPEIQLDGASSRAVFRFSGSEGTPYPNQRVAFLGLETSGRPAVTDGGRTLEYNLMRGTLTADGEKVFAGFYPGPTNNGFGCVSVSFTLP